jgi:hypothetical protein
MNGLWVSVVGLFAPSLIRRSASAHDYYCILLCLKPEAKAPKPEAKPAPKEGTRQDVIRVRATTLDELREEIIKRWPNAVFTGEFKTKGE